MLNVRIAIIIDFVDCCLGAFGQLSGTVCILNVSKRAVTCFSRMPNMDGTEGAWDKRSTSSAGATARTEDNERTPLITHTANSNITQDYSNGSVFVVMEMIYIILLS